MHRPLALALGILAGTTAIQSARLAASVGGTAAAAVAIGLLGLWSGRRIVQRRARGARWALTGALLAVPAPTLVDGASWSPGQVSGYLALAAVTAMTVQRRPVARPALRLVRSEA